MQSSRWNRFLGAGVIALAFGVSAAQAQDAPQGEVIAGGGAVVTLHLHGFLSSEEVTVLRHIAASPEARQALLGDTADGHAAIAVAPEEGFIRDGVPVGSASALSELPDAQSAREAALEACDAARAAGGAECVVVFEVAPDN